MRLARRALCLSALLLLSSCRGGAERDMADSALLGSAVSAASVARAYHRERKQILQVCPHRPGSWAELMSPKLTGESGLLLEDLPLRWRGRQAWGRQADGLPGKSAGDAIISVGSPLGPGECQLALGKAEWDEFSSAFEGFDASASRGQQILATVYLPPENSPATGGPCRGRILAMRLTSGLWRDGRRTGEWSEQSVAGRLLEKGSYRAGIRTGRWTFYWSNGHPRRAGCFRDGKEEGAWRSWYSGGAPLSEGSYHGGLRQGTWRSHYEDSVLERRERYLAGKLEGEALRQWPNGKLRERGHYRSGKREGAWVYHSPKGHKLLEGRFKKGERVGRWHRWDKWGEYLGAKNWVDGRPSDS